MVDGETAARQAAVFAGKGRYPPEAIPSRPVDGLSQLRPPPPALPFRPDDAAGRVLHVSSTTGEVVLASSRAERGWSWVGTVLHWIYLRPLRAHAGLWRDLVLWLSAACLAASLSGCGSASSACASRNPTAGSGWPAPTAAGNTGHHLFGWGGCSPPPGCSAAGFRFRLSVGRPAASPRWTKGGSGGWPSATRPRPRGLAAALAAAGRCGKWCGGQFQGRGYAELHGPREHRRIDGDRSRLPAADPGRTGRCRPATRPGALVEAARLDEADTYYYNQPLPVVRIRFAGPDAVSYYSTSGNPAAGGAGSTPPTAGTAGFSAPCIASIFRPGEFRPRPRNPRPGVSWRKPASPLRPVSGLAAAGWRGGRGRRVEARSGGGGQHRRQPGFLFTELSIAYFALPAALAAAVCPAPAAEVATLTEVKVSAPPIRPSALLESASEGTVTAPPAGRCPLAAAGRSPEAVPGHDRHPAFRRRQGQPVFPAGFNLDHGSDFRHPRHGHAVNMVSHAHGQGYMDLNFMIPELISGVAYRKGMSCRRGRRFFHRRHGRIDYRRRLDGSFAEIAVGQHNFRRLLVAGGRPGATNTTDRRRRSRGWATTALGTARASGRPTSFCA